MKKIDKPNSLAELKANIPNPINLKSNLSNATLKALERFGPSSPTASNPSPVTLKALERFGPGSTTKSNPQNRPELLPLPGTDWELWAHMPKATLIEAVAVSLDIDPSATKPGSAFVVPGKEYDRRLKLACAYVSHTGPLKSLDTLPPDHLLYGPAKATVSLPQFGEWARSMGWALPEKFPRWRSMPAETTTSKPAPANKPLRPWRLPALSLRR